MPFGNTSSVVSISRPKPADTLSDLLDLLGPVDGLHVLVIGPGSLDAMMALYRRGAASVTGLRAGCVLRVPASDAMLVLGLAEPGLVSAVLAQARRSLQPLNAIVVQVAHDAPAGLLPQLRHRLVESGFSLGRAATVGGCPVIAADLPLYGHLKCA